MTEVTEILRVENFFLSIDNKIILDDVSFSLKRGKTLGIIGPSGCGKSILSHALMRLHQYKVSGGVYFQNRNILTLDEKEMQQIRGHQMALIFQDVASALNPLMRIEKQLKECQPVEALPTLLKSVGLEDKAILKLYPHELSGGMRQRVMIAIALAKRPQILICDEPVLALDSELQEQILKLLKDLQAAYGLSLIFIDHHLNLVSKFCDEVLILNKGKLGGLIRSQRSLLELCHEDWGFLAAEKSPQGFGQGQFSTGCG